MPAPPPNKLTANTARPVKRLVVLLGDEAGANPTTEDEVDFLKPLSIHWTTGGKALSSAVFEYDLAKTGERLVDQRTPTKWTRIVEVRQVTGDDIANAAVLFWGELSVQEDSIDKTGERATVTAAIESWHFGDGENGSQLRGMQVYDLRTEAVVTITTEDIVFNPVVDGLVLGNRSTHKEGVDEEAEDAGYYVWVDAEQVRTSPARLYALEGESAEQLWTLREALNTIQRCCNPEETWIKNDIDPGAVADWLPLKSATLPTGGTLPQYLDALLEPIGCSWYIALGVDEDGASTRQIKIFNRTQGPVKDLVLQRPGEALDPAKSKVVKLGRRTDISALANKVLCEGGPEEREITIELLRAWDAADDDLGTDDLKRSDQTSLYYTDDKVDVWRLWVANEAGDWKDVRNTDTPYTIPDFSTVFSEYVERRRAFHECLTTGSHDARLKPFLEYQLEDEWLPVPTEWGYQVLRDQMGTRFTGDTPPEDLVKLGANAKLRITGTIIGDKRLEATGDGTENSPNARVIRMTLDVSDRFVDRKRVSTGDYASLLIADHLNSDQRQDTAAIQEYADKIVSWETAADVMVSATNFGINLDLQLGDMIKRVKGRELDLNRNSRASGTQRYPQLVGITWQMEPPSTELTLSAYDTFHAWNVALPAKKTSRKPPVARRNEEQEMPFVPPLDFVFTHRVITLDDAINLWRRDVTKGTSFEANGISVKNCGGVAIGADNTYWATYPLRRYSSSGAVIFTGALSGPAAAVNAPLDSDAAGNLYQLVNGNPTEVHLRKWDPDGNVLWSVPVGGAEVNSIARVDDAGNCFLTFAGPDIRLEKYSTNGVFLWRHDDQLFGWNRVDRVTGNSGHGQFLLDPDGGELHDFGTTGLGLNPNLIIALGGNRIWVAKSDGKFYIHDATTYALLAETDNWTGSYYTALTVGLGLPDGSALIGLGSTDLPDVGTVYPLLRIDDDGELLWRVSLGFRNTIAVQLLDAAVSADRVILGGYAATSLSGV